MVKGGGTSWSILLVVALVILCELSPSVDGGPAKKPGKPPAGGSRRRTYHKQYNKACNPAYSECSVNNMLTCHPTKKVCVCIYRIHEWSDAEYGCYNPAEGKPNKDDIKDEVKKEVPTDGEADKIVPPKGTEEDPPTDGGDESPPVDGATEEGDEGDATEDPEEGGGDDPATEPEDEKRRRRKFARILIGASRKSNSKRTIAQKATKKPPKKIG